MPPLVLQNKTTRSAFNEQEEEAAWSSPPLAVGMKQIASKEVRYSFKALTPQRRTSFVPDRLSEGRKRKSVESSFLGSCCWGRKPSVNQVSPADLLCAVVAMGCL